MTLRPIRPVDGWMKRWAVVGQPHQLVEACYVNGGSKPYGYQVNDLRLGSVWSASNAHARYFATLRDVREALADPSAAAAAEAETSRLLAVDAARYGQRFTAYAVDSDGTIWATRVCSWSATGADQLGSTP